MKKIKIGKITGVRGLKGEVKVLSFTNMQDQRFKPGTKVYLAHEKKSLTVVIESHQVIKGNDFLVFASYNHINDVEELIGAEIFSDEKQVLDLAENEFLVQDLIGLTVFQGEEAKGKVKDVLNLPQGDYLLVDTPDGERLVPFHDQFILFQSNEKIVVIEMEGLL
mgnify:CR=1 FL=1